MADALEPADPLWARLRAATPARIGLPRAGASLATSALLAFQLAHARARDAVHEALDGEALAQALRARGLVCALLRSAAPDRTTYLSRPDLGRRLDPASREGLEAPPGGCDLVFVLADGLSARAVATHAPALLDAVLPVFRDSGWRIGPATVVTQGRVAIGFRHSRSLATIPVHRRRHLVAPDITGP